MLQPEAGALHMKSTLQGSVEIVLLFRGGGILRQPESRNAPRSRAESGGWERGGGPRTTRLQMAKGDPPGLPVLLRTLDSKMKSISNFSSCFTPSK